MFTIELPDGSKRHYDHPVTGLSVAESISINLAKEAVAVQNNGVLMDLNRLIDHDCTVHIITKKQEQALEVMRHDAAHVFAEAVKELYPETQISIGPAIENGFYYDVYREQPFVLDDLERIEERMRDIVDRDEPIVREEWSREKAISFFKNAGEHLKVEIIESIPGHEPLSFYRQGNFIDLCRGPHLPSTGRLGKSFKLMKLAGAYWRGDSNNIMLQRFYGTAWANDKQLKDYLTMLEEAEKRDHRRLGRQLELFHIQDEAPGSVFWHPNGWTIYRILQDYIRSKISKAGYQEVNTPILLDRAFWVTSGHWDKYRHNMFTTEEIEDRQMAVKPMNCPCHVQIFKQGTKSYRDLPLRLAEFGTCHRNEPSGSLHGLMRVRAFTQDDAHIFCTEQQITSETKAFCELLQGIYNDFGFTDIKVKFSTRPDVRAGSDEVWDRAEASLRQATMEAGLDYSSNPGEGAFYGPKLEFVLKDAIGRDWQCGTLQVDYCIPERLDATYIGEDGGKHTPVMLHRAVLGSFERFIGILIEHYAGRFPLWLAPTQVIVIPITDDTADYAHEITDLLRNNNIRVELDQRNEKVSYKIRAHSHAKVPLLMVVGKREQTDRTIALRRLGGETQEILALHLALDKLVSEAKIPQ